MRTGVGNTFGIKRLEGVMLSLIVAVLFGLLVPLYSRAMDRAHLPQCLANTRQIGISLQLYMQDSDGVFPVLHKEAAHEVGDAWGEGYAGHWRNFGVKRRNYHKSDSIGAQLMPYVHAAGVDNWRIWTCPADKGAASNGALGMRWSSYHYRSYLTAGLAEGYQNNPGMAGKTWREQEFAYQSQTFVFSENWIWHDDRLARLPWLHNSLGWSPHARIQLVFMDGHTDSVPVDRCMMRAPYWVGQGYDPHWPRRDDLRDCD